MWLVDPLYDTGPPGGGLPGDPSLPVDPSAGARLGFALVQPPGPPSRKWAYHTSSADPLVAAVTDTTIVLLKVQGWADSKDGVFTWAGSGGNTILQQQVAEDGTFALDNLHLVVPAGEDLDLTMSVATLGTSGCTSWWYEIKELHVSSPALD